VSGGDPARQLALARRDALEEMKMSNKADGFFSGATAVRRASECLWQGCMEIWAREAEFFQVQALETMALWQGLSRVRGPDEVMPLEMGFAKEEMEKGFVAVKDLGEAVWKSWTGAMEKASKELTQA
jgi:hypothetical protein